MGKKIFTVKEIESLKKKEKPYQKREGNGFGVRVHETGEKSFFYSYKINGRPRFITFGSFPVLKLADARKMFSDAKSMVANGGDPLGKRENEKREPTVKRIMEEYLFDAEKRIKSIKEEKRIIEKYTPRSWRNQRIKNITRKQIKDCMKPLAEPSPQMANKALKTIKRLFAFAVDEDYLENNPAYGIKQLAPAPSRERYLSESEIKTIWAALDTASMSNVVRRVLRLALITGQRVGEISGMMRSEIDGRWWTIPAIRTKNSSSHRIYLTDMALSLIGDTEGLIFPSPIKHDRPVTVQALSSAVRLNKFIGVEHWTPHDLRRTASSHMTSIGVAEKVVEKILNHTDSSVAGVYNRHSYDREKQNAMEVWQQKLEIILTGKPADNIVPLFGG